MRALCGTDFERVNEPASLPGPRAPVDTLIRFVVAPDGAVVPDFRRRLPGRGIWVTARADHVETAERRRLFARVHGGPVNIEPGLANRVEQGLASAALAALSLARKGGTVVSGFAKVEAGTCPRPGNWHHSRSRRGL